MRWPTLRKTAIAFIASVTFFTAVPAYGAQVATGTPVTPRVVGGTPLDSAVLASGMGWIYSLGRLCTGSFIRADLLLTAAHCVTDREQNVLPVSAVSVGHSLSGDRVGRTYPVKELIPHPEYAVDSVNDIAIISLAVHIPGVVPLAVDPDPVTEGTEATVAGWGMDYDDQFPTRAHMGSLTTLPDDVCGGQRQLEVGKFTYIGYVGFDAERALCAGGENASGRAVDACRGDSGGPLVTSWGPSQSSSLQAVPLVGAVVSRGYGCGDDVPPEANLPPNHVVAGWYTRVHPYRQWIEGVAASTPPIRSTWLKPQDLRVKRLSAGVWNVSASLDSPAEATSILVTVRWKSESRSCTPRESTHPTLRGCRLALPRSWGNWRVAVSVSYPGDFTVRSTSTKVIASRAS